MAVSVANTLTPHLWKDEPMVVVRGKFVLGLTGGGRFAPFLYLPSLADSAAVGQTFSLQVLGLFTTVNGPGNVDGPVYGGIEIMENFQAYRTDYSGSMPSRGTAYSNAGYFGEWIAPKVFCVPNLDSSSYGTGSSAESYMRSRCSYLGELVAPDLRIVLRGALARLDITGIAAAGFKDDDSTLGYDVETNSNNWYSQYGYSGDGFSPVGVGWRPTDIHVYDNPQLHGHVTAGGVPVIWE